MQDNLLKHLFNNIYIIDKDYFNTLLFDCNEDYEIINGKMAAVSKLHILFMEMMGASENIGENQDTDFIICYNLKDDGLYNCNPDGVMSYGVQEVRTFQEMSKPPSTMRIWSFFGWEEGLSMFEIMMSMLSHCKHYLRNGGTYTIIADEAEFKRNIEGYIDSENFKNETMFLIVNYESSESLAVEKFFNPKDVIKSCLLKYSN